MPAAESPGSLNLRRLWRDGRPQERWLVLGGWCLSLLACLALGLASVIWHWSGLPLSLAGLTIYLSIYPPLSLCLWWTLALGWRWGALPAYLSTLALALHAGMAWHWALLFACANPLGLGVLALGYRAVGASRALRDLRAWLFYVPLAFAGAIFSSAGALIWTSAQQLPASQLLPVWQGWWLGAFVQSLLLAAPLLMLSWPALQRWQGQRPDLFDAAPRGQRALGMGLLLAIVLAVLGYGLLSLGLGSLQLREALQGQDWGRLQEAARIMLGTAWVFFWVFACIVLFVALFGYQALSRWLHATQALVSQLARANAELERRSRTDGLTGLTNRMASEETLRAMLRATRRYGTPSAVLMLDIDHFKQVNDRYGHEAGDTVIRALARSLQSATREVDLAGRFGGEEFVIGLSHSDIDGALAFAERLRQRIAQEKVDWGGQSIGYTVSIGVTRLQPSDADITAALRRADTAMYRAKQLGRNRVELARD
jgi:diguanylate cyclase (GGDEF)-like protein